MTAEQPQVVHRSLDGRRFGLSGPLDLAAPGTSVVDVTIGGRLHELTSGGIGLGDDIAAALGITGFDDELSFQGGVLRLARSRPYDPRTGLTEDRLLAVWCGTAHSMVLQVYGTGVAELVGMLRTLRVTEHDDGIALLPEPAAGSYFTGPATVLKQVPGLGLLELSPLTAAHARTLPAWRGAPAEAGELFADSLSDGSPYYVLAGAQAWTTLVPLADTAADRLAALAGQLRIEVLG